MKRLQFGSQRAKSSPFAPSRIWESSWASTPVRNDAWLAAISRSSFSRASRDEFRNLLFAGSLTLCGMGRVDSGGIRPSKFSEALELLLQYRQLRCFDPGIVHLLVHTTQIRSRLPQLALELLQFALNCLRLLLLKAIEKLQLGFRARCDLFDFVLAEDVGREYLIAIKGDGDGGSHFVQDLNGFLSTAASCVSHICLGAEFDLESAASQVGFHQSVDCTVPLRIRLWIRHESKAEAKEFENRRLASSPASDQTVQAVRKFEMCTG